jgi:hypothetical protein
LWVAFSGAPLHDEYVGVEDFARTYGDGERGRDQLGSTAAVVVSNEVVVFFWIFICGS